MSTEKTYKIKELYYTLQGEGAQAGRAAVFCRFSGCNLWSGREVDRPKAVCQFCDTDFRGTDGPGGGTYSGDRLAGKIASLWPEGQSGNPLVVCTGGEPLLQLDEFLIDHFHRAGFEVAIETNGTVKVPEGVDWVCMSPKAGTELVVQSGNEIKIVVPQHGLDPEAFADWNFDHFFIQPMDGPALEKNTRWAIQYCLEHPQWRLSVQTHKVIGIS